MFYELYSETIIKDKFKYLVEIGEIASIEIAPLDKDFDSIDIYISMGHVRIQDIMWFIDQCEAGCTFGLDHELFPYINPDQSRICQMDEIWSTVGGQLVKLFDNTQIDFRKDISVKDFVCSCLGKVIYDNGEYRYNTIGSHFDWLISDENYEKHHLVFVRNLANGVVSEGFITTDDFPEFQILNDNKVQINMEDGFAVVDLKKGGEF